MTGWEFCPQVTWPRPLIGKQIACRIVDPEPEKRSPPRGGGLRAERRGAYLEGLAVQAGGLHRDE